MIYTFYDEAGAESLHVKGELYKYLVKVRRHSEGDELCFRSYENIEILHTYKVLHLEPRALSLALVSSKKSIVQAKAPLHVGWCVVDMKSVEKVLASLCEVGVSKITFISCDRSQKNFKTDFKRLDRIVEASMQQSGRSSFMEFTSSKNIQTFIKDFPDTRVFDFCETALEDGANFQTVLIGCEGGFSKDEREFLKTQESFRLKTPMVLRSETAVLAVASKILL